MSPPAPIEIPQSANTVEVKIINVSWVDGIETADLLEPSIAAHTHFRGCPCYAFLITNKAADGKTSKIFFDLGIPANHETNPHPYYAALRERGWGLRNESDVLALLKEQNIPLSDINAIIWSHYHFDHTGAPEDFPSSTDLVVGPGFSAAQLPGFPENPKSSVCTISFDGRKMREIDFKKEGNGLRIGDYAALDYFGDGSFYLLDTPGHCAGHMCALARTTASPPSFMFLGGDIAHHCGEFRPNQYQPLPDEISPNPLYPVNSQASACPGDMFTNVYEGFDRKQPVYQPTAKFQYDIETCKDTIRKMYPFDGRDDVFTLLAHDPTVLDVLDFFPKTANAWMEKGWGRASHWRFLADLLPEGKSTGKQ
jgi:glyoxylase-like metal-dependent hydrolase (beta-lactamase superfamily II)